MGGYYFYGYDSTYILVVIGLIIVLYAQFRIKITYGKYKSKRINGNYTGADAAREILKKNGLDLYVVETSGELTDHYDPRKKVIRLSKDIYEGTTIAAISVAAHECGHAVQDKEGYFFFRLRSTLVPFVNLVSYLGYFAIIVAIFTSYMGYLTIGIATVLATLVFQLVTLPVEFDASRRGLKEIKQLNLLDSKEYNGAKSMLKAAAFTYVAGTISTILQLLRLVLLFNRRRD